MRELFLEELNKISGGMDYAVPVPPNPESFREAVLIGGITGGVYAGAPGVPIGAIEGGLAYIGYNVYENVNHYLNNNNRSYSEFPNSNFNSFGWGK